MTGEPSHVALASLANRTLPPETKREALKFHTSPAIDGGQVEVHRLANGFRIDVIGTDNQGKPARLATQHHEDLGQARLIGAWTGAVLCIGYRDFTVETPE